MVPATFVVVFAMGTDADVSRYWLAVLLAGYACYGTLRWTAARPPRIVTPGASTSALAATNAYVLSRVSHQLTTFPSGHVAVSTAAAVALIPVCTTAAILAGGMALAIAVAAVAGRYHYAVDVILGAVTGAVPALLLLAL
jgi:membrane-associated phospholipid phosphatase